MKKLIVIMLIMISCSDPHIAYINDKSGANLRKLPTTKSNIILSIPYKESVKVLGYSKHSDKIYNITSKWAQVEYGNKKGWVFGSLISDFDNNNFNNGLYLIYFLIFILLLILLYFMIKFKIPNQIYKNLNNVYEKSKIKYISSKNIPKFNARSSKSTKQLNIADNNQSKRIFPKPFVFIAFIYFIYFAIINDNSIVLFSYNNNEKTYLRLLIFNENVNNNGLNYYYNNCSIYRSIGMHDIYDQELIRYIKINESVCSSKRYFEQYNKETSGLLLLFSSWLINPPKFINDLDKAAERDNNQKEIISLSNYLYNKYYSIYNFYSKLNYSNKQYFYSNNSFKYKFLHITP